MWDFFFPGPRSYSRWTLGVLGGLQYAVQDQDQYSPLGLPMLVLGQFDLFDSRKHIRVVPLAIGFTGIQNGRGRVFESFSYSLEVGSTSIDMWLHPYVHLHYDLGLYRAGFEHHVGGAGLNLRLGVRIPFWFRSSDPRTYQRHHLHLVVLPLSAVFLARLDKADLSGFDLLLPVLNGHAGLEYAHQLTSWFRLQAQFYAHWNWTQNQEFILRAELLTTFRFAPWVSLSVIGKAHIPIRPAELRSNLYGLYHLRFFSFGAEARLDFTIIEDDGSEDHRPYVYRKVGPSPFQHDLQLTFTYLNDHTGLDTGFYPEFRYRLRHAWWLDLEVGLRWGPPTAGDLLRYYLIASVHMPLTFAREFSFRVGWMHSSYNDIQRGENLLLMLNHIDTKHFEFQGGFAVRSAIHDSQQAHNPFAFATGYMEITLLFDIRGKLEFEFPKLGGSVLQVGFGLMDFLASDILSSNTMGYHLFARWRQPKIGTFELQGGLMSYSLIDLAGFYGRWFLSLQYTYTFGGPRKSPPSR